MEPILTPVVELEPWSYSVQERAAPEGSLTENPDGWLAYWSQSLADSGIVDLPPWPPGTFLVPVRQLTDQSLATVIQHVLADLEEDAEPDEIPPLPGGHVLSGVDGPVFAPACCCDLGDLDSWAAAASGVGTEWTMLWTGHPWRLVRERDGALELSEPTEETAAPAGPSLAVAARVRPDDLERAVAVARSQQGGFARRLTAALTTGPAADVVPEGVSVEETVAGLLGRHE